jgi:hypothetical protein
MTRSRPAAPRTRSPWSPPTRRAFLAALGTAAAALAIENRAVMRALGGATSDLDDERPRSPWSGTTRWIGHC